ncbi:MAG: baseplate J/gp47 family protein, partial [Methylovulum sp.]
LYEAFDFRKLPAQRSIGTINVKLLKSASVLKIPAGTAFISIVTNDSFYSVEDATVVTVNNEKSADILLSAKKQGIINPVIAQSPFTSDAVPSFVSASAKATFSNGRPEETDEEMRYRFMDYIQNLARSPLASIHYALVNKVFITNENGEEIERIKQAKIVEKFILDSTSPPGVFYAYIHNGNNGTITASAALITQTLAILNGYTDNTGKKIIGYKAAGIQVKVEAVENKRINVDYTAQINNTVDKTVISTAITDAIKSYFNSTDIGGTIYVAELISSVMALPGVINVHFNSPVSDMTASFNQKNVLGTINNAAQ